MMASRDQTKNASMRWSAVLLCVLLTPLAWSQQKPAQRSEPTPGSVDTGSGAAKGVELDSVVAVVNGDLILESDIDEERRLAAFQPFHDERKRFGRDEAVQRLIDRMLILQQAKLQPEDQISNAAVNEQLAILRKDIPACKQYHCETDAGWKKFVGDQGFTLDELTQQWRERMAVLRFIEVRFRMGIHISDDEIKSYYDKTLVPQYAREKAAAPELGTIFDRIQEILLQQQVGSLLDEWLKTLRAQGTVRMMNRSEVAR